LRNAPYAIFIYRCTTSWSYDDGKYCKLSCRLLLELPHNNTSAWNITTKTTYSLALKGKLTTLISTLIWLIIILMDILLVGTCRLFSRSALRLSNKNSTLLLPHVHYTWNELVIIIQRNEQSYCYETNFCLSKAICLEVRDAFINLFFRDLGCVFIFLLSRELLAAALCLVWKGDFCGCSADRADACLNLLRPDVVLLQESTDTRGNCSSLGWALVIAAWLPGSNYLTWRVKFITVHLLWK